MSSVCLHVDADMKNALDLKGGFPSGSPTAAEVTPTVSEDAMGAASVRAADIAKTPAPFLLATNSRMPPTQIAGRTRNDMAGHRIQLMICKET